MNSLKKEMCFYSILNQLKSEVIKKCNFQVVMYGKENTTYSSEKRVQKIEWLQNSFYLTLTKIVCSVYSSKGKKASDVKRKLLFFNDNRSTQTTHSAGVFAILTTHFRINSAASKNFSALHHRPPTAHHHPKIFLIK